MAKIEITIDTNDHQDLEALKVFLENLEVAGPTPKTPHNFVEPKGMIEPETKKAVKSRKPKKEDPTPKDEDDTDQDESPKEESKPEEKEVPADSTKGKSKIEIEEVRTLLSTKVANHREAIKNKLTEYGAKNVTALESSKYEDFVDFLNNLG